MHELWSHTVSQDGATCTVALSGELDMSGSDDVLKVLLAAIDAPGVTAVRIDLGDVDFLDSSGIQALAVAFRTAQASSRSLTVVRPRAHVLRVLEIAGLLPLLTASPVDSPSSGDQLAG